MLLTAGILSIGVLLCADGQTAGLAGRTASPPPAAVIPMRRNRHDVYTVEVTVGRSLLFSGDPEADPVPFIVDTGANRTAVPRLIADQLVAQDQISLDQIGHAMTGQFETGLIFVDQLDFGIGAREVEVAVFEERFGSVMSAAGILGSNAFGHEIIELDFPAGEMRLLTERAAPDSSPLRLEDGLITGAGRIRGLEGAVRVFIDTGATASIANTALAHRRRTVSLDDSVEIDGVSGGETARGDLRRMLGGLQAGELCLGMFEITVSDVYFFDQAGWMQEPAIILGMDVLQHARLSIDYGSGEVQLNGLDKWAC